MTKIVCMNVADEPDPIDGSTIVRADCGHDVWISVASVALMLDRDAKPICINCARPLIEGGKVEVDAKPTPAQLEEIRRKLGQ